MRQRLIPALALFLLVGCSKIHEQRSFTLEPRGGNTLSISAPLSEQKVKVAVTSDEPVDVWVLLEKDLPPGNKDYFDPDAKMKSGILASEKKTRDATLQATIPGKEKYQIYVSNPGDKAANVTVKVDSQ
jgi:uncharacterized protein YcfL